LIEPMSGMPFSDPDDDARDAVPETRPVDNRPAAFG